MTNSFLAEFDALARDAFVDAGMADAAQYRVSPAGELSPCVILIDRTVVETDEFGGTVIVANAVEVTAFREHIAARPPLGAQFVVGSEVFTVGKMKKADESRWVALCKV